MGHWAWIVGAIVLTIYFGFGALCGLFFYYISSIQPKIRGCRLARETEKFLRKA